MKILDVNLLLYAVNGDAPQHGKAKQWLEGLLSGTESVGFAWAALIAFIRLSTRARVFSKPLSLDQAVDLLNAWLAQPCAVIVHPTERHAKFLKDLLLPLGTAGNLTSDAHLAALSIEHGAELCSCDADFARFPGVRWINPIQ